MRHILKSWFHIENKCRKADLILLALDYDGTLTPIVSSPEKALLSPNVKKLIISLKNKPNFSIGVITGRALSDIKNLVGIEDIYYAANHGFEIEGRGVKFRHSSYLKFAKYLEKIADELRHATKDIKGAIVEDKGFTLSLHYRMVKGERIAKIKRIFKRICQQYLKSRRIKITEGKKVLEVRPAFKWNKAGAFQMIKRIVLAEKKNIKNILSIYIGDDKTDEDIFQVIKEKDISIFVGKAKSSKAKYFLSSTKEVAQFLKKLDSLPC